MGDVEHGHVVRLLQARQQIENLRLHGDIQGGGRFVGNQELGFGGDRHRNHRPLPLSAGKLEGIGKGFLLRLADAGFRQEFDRPRPCLFFVQTQMQGQHFGNLRADAHHGVKRGHRLLKHHAYFPPAQLLQGAFGLGQQIVAVEFQTTVKRHQRIQPHNALRQHGFTAAALADQCQFPAGLYGQADIVQDLLAGEKGV